MSVERRPCVRCGRPTAAGNLVHGLWGPDCARILGLVGDTTDTGHTGPTLLDLLDETGPETGLRATLRPETGLPHHPATPETANKRDTP